MKVKYVFPLSFILVVFLTSANLFNQSKQNIQEPKEISEQAFDSIIKTHVVLPIEKKMAEVNPKLFMTKCKSYVSYFIHQETSYNKSKNQSPTQYSILSTYSGTVYFLECGHQSTIADFRINLTDKVPTLRESYFDEWSSLEEFLHKKFK